MKPIEFEEQNKVFTKPDSMSDEECQSLNVFVDGNSIVSCWEVTDKELEEIKKNKKVWLIVIGNGQPPVSLEAFKPIVYPEKE